MRNISFFISRIVPNLEDDESPTSKSDLSDTSGTNDANDEFKSTTHQIAKLQNLKGIQTESPEDDEIGDGLRTNKTANTQTDISQQIHSERIQTFTGQVERRRRKLPEIPTNKRCKLSPCKGFT